ncbi:sensor histidine kinase [Roseimarinus sediminis]|uniref:sensor histidine kinase n=1 Tax=Roseimarinus sediminis TaxID=1610899 RepID=UPI003D2372E5
MSKLKVNALIVLMAISLAGIIFLQLLWMKNAVQLKNEIFQQNVNEALRQTSHRVETINDVFWVRRLVGPAHQPGRNDLMPGSRRNFQFEYQIESDSVKADRKAGLQSRIGQWTMENTPDSLNNRELKIEIYKVDSLIEKWEERIEHNITIVYDSISKQRNYRPNDHRGRFGARTERLKQMAGRMVFESWASGQQQTPDTALINALLYDELKQRNISLPFEMGVFYADDRLIASPGADSLLLSSSTHRIKLFQGAIFDHNNQLSVYFPRQNWFVLKTLLLPAILSLLLSGLVLAVFVLSIYYILRQKKVSAMKSDFINNMTHEFKTPLATISVAADTILNPKVIDNREQVTKFTRVIKEENKRMNQQVETILQIARLDKREFEFKFEQLNLHQLAQKAVEAIRLQVEKRGGSIEAAYKAEHAVVMADQQHVFNLINNLLDNANKYSPGEPVISISTFNSERGVWLKVSDQGIGMSKQVQQKAFEHFYRETSGNIHNVKGFGLGLSYVKAVVEAHHGEVGIESQPGSGTTFSVFFPFVHND